MKGTNLFIGGCNCQLGPCQPPTVGPQEVDWPLRSYNEFQFNLDAIDAMEVMQGTPDYE